MDIWNPTEADKKTPEYLRFITHFLQSGGQQRSDWLFYRRWGDYLSPLPKTKIKIDEAFTEDNHYVLKGCNLHDRAEWVQYVRTDGDYSKAASSSWWKRTSD